MALLLDMAIKVSLLMLVTGAALVLLRRASAASRHVVLTAALAAVVLLPVTKLALPALPLFVLAPDPQPAVLVPSTPVVPAANPFTPISAAAPSVVSPLDQRTLAAPAVNVAAPARGPLRTLGTLTGAVAMLWVIGAAAVLLKVAAAVAGIRTLARAARSPEDSRMTERLSHIQSQFGVRRPVTLLVSRHEWMPITWGLFRPSILLPASAATWLDEHPGRLEAVLVHEMAHIARRDALAQRISRVAVAIFWFNPLVWLAARRARLERERACDDAVLASGLRASDYANDLIALARALAVPSRAAANALAMARRSQLEQRVRALLDHRLSRRGASGFGRFVAIALMLLMAPVAAVQLAARPLAAAPAQIATIGRTPVDAQEPAPAAPAIATPAATEARNDAPAVASEPLPQTPQSPTVTYSAVQQPSNWPAERDAMYRQLVERARKIVKDTRTKIEIGTAAPIEARPLEETLALIERAAAAAANGLCATPDPFAAVGGGGRCIEGTWATPAGRSGAANPLLAPPPAKLPTDEQVASAKAAFATTNRNLDVAIVRWDNGLLTSAEIDAALQGVLKVLTSYVITPDRSFFFFNQPDMTAADRASADQLYALLTGRVSSITPAPAHTQMYEPIRFVTRSGTNTLSDAQVIDLLKTLPTTPMTDTERANALLDLSSRHAFTPEMVALYVAAARSIKSPTEEARVFAQAIRVK